MFRTLLKWRISAAVDRDAELPAALRACVERDAELAVFESASRRLTARLRREAPAWLDQQGAGGASAATAAAPHSSLTQCDGKLRPAAGRGPWVRPSGFNAKAALAAFAQRRLRQLERGFGAQHLEADQRILRPRRQRGQHCRGQEGR